MLYVHVQGKKVESTSCISPFSCQLALQHFMTLLSWTHYPPLLLLSHNRYITARCLILKAKLTYVAELICGLHACKSAPVLWATCASSVHPQACMLAVTLCKCLQQTWLSLRGGHESCCCLGSPVQGLCSVCFLLRCHTKNNFCYNHGEAFQHLACSGMSICVFL